MTLKIAHCYDAHDDDLAAWWQAAKPENPACMIMTLRKLTVYPTLPDDIDLAASLEGRLFWKNGELRWQRFDAFDGSKRRPHLHVVVTGDWLTDVRLTNGANLKSGVDLASPAIWEKRTVGGKEIFSVQEETPKDEEPKKIKTRLWFDDMDRGYFQWCALNGKEECDVNA